jgi:hypothetical protein
MKDVHQVLHQKEMDLARVRREIEELRSIIRWLAADRTGSTDASGESLPTSGRTPKWFLERDERAA